MAAVGGVYEGIDGIGRFLTDIEDAAADFRIERELYDSRVTARRQALDSLSELPRRGGCVRPLHGPLLGAAGTTACRFRDDRGWSASARRRLRSGRSHYRAGKAVASGVRFGS